MTRVVALSSLAAVSIAQQAPELCHPGQFLQPSPIGVPEHYETFDVADFDGDGHQDLLTGIRSAFNEFVIAFGNGDGTFSAGPPISGIFAQALTAGDVNGDDIPDIVWTSFNSASFARGLGNGTFAAPLQTLLVNNNWGRLEVADLDGDGRDDVVTIGSHSPPIPHLAVLKGQAAGPLLLVSEQDTSESIVDINLADTNEDGTLDLVATLNPDFVAIYRGLGNATFGLPTLVFVGPGAGQAAVADFDDDGTPDLAVPTAGGLTFLRGLGNDVFLAGIQTLVLGSSRSTVADMNLDEIPDVLVGSVVALGPASPTFEDVRTHLGTGYPVFVLDADEDGWPDVASGTFLLRGDGTGNLASPQAFGPGFAPARMLAVDLDGGGRDEVIVIGQARVSSFPTTEDGRLGPRLWTAIYDTLPVCCFSSAPLTVLHADGDAHWDLVVASDEGEVRVYPGVGDGTFGAPVTFAGPLDITELQAGDLDNDGDDDILLIALFGNNPLLFLSNGDGTYQPGPPPPISGFGLRLADLDEDGNLDILTLDFGDGVAIARGRGDGTFDTATLVSVPAAQWVLEVGDLDGDTHIDVITSSSENFDYKLLLLRGDGNGGLSLPIQLQLPAEAQRLIARDFDGDSIVDLVVLLRATNVVTGYFQGLGGMAYREPELIDVGDTFGWIAAGNIDAGPFPDILAIQGSLYVVRNTRLGARVPPPTGAICAGSLLLRAEIAGFGVGEFQWRRNGVPLANSGAISGANSPELLIFPAEPEDSGSYDLVIGDTCSVAISNAVTVSIVAPPDPPTISVLDLVPADLPFLTASVPGEAGHVYVWTLTGGTITAGQGTSQIVFTSGPAGTTMQISVTDTVAGCSTASPSTAVQVQFADVNESDPFSPFIHTIARNGVTAGCGNGNFCPEALVTRAQMAVFLLRSKNGATYTPPAATGLVFLDVPANAFAAAFIEALAAAQVTAGCGGGNYCPDAFVTRAEMAVFLIRTLEGPGYTPPPAQGTIFADVGSGDFAAAYIEQLYFRGITSGCGGGNYCPADFLPRAQMAVFLTQTFDLE
jgi:hypothetical protein